MFFVRENAIVYVIIAFSVVEEAKNSIAKIYKII
jgi:hypothetical protein